MRVLILIATLVASAYCSSVLDLFDSAEGHEPRVAVNCGMKPFHVNVETGKWEMGKAPLCDRHKEKVKKYCQTTYPHLNVTNIVEANEPIEFSNWCDKKDRCMTHKKVTPYRCLVHEYEADALMVPNGCTFDHMHDDKLCLKHDQWKVKAKEACAAKKQELNNYGILLSCGTDLFTGVEFVCCPKHAQEKREKKLLKKQHQKMKKEKKQQKKHQKQQQKLKKKHQQKKRDALNKAITEFQQFLPLETKGCDRSKFGPRETSMDERHRDRVAAVVDEWDEAEQRYNKLRTKDPIAAEEKMKRTLLVFRETLAALEEESKEEKERLRTERAACIDSLIAKNKRDAMLEYIVSVEEQPPNSKRILKTVKKFIQVCEHDRVHSLRHFEHVRNRNVKKANGMRANLLKHLKDLNVMVNESMAILTHLPKIAQQFGIDDMSVMLKPRLMMPEIQPVKTHVHESIPEELLPVPEDILAEGEKEDEDEDEEEAPEVEMTPIDGTREPTDLPTEKSAPVKEIPPVTIEAEKLEPAVNEEKEKETVPPPIVMVVEEDYHIVQEGDKMREKHREQELKPEVLPEDHHRHHGKRSAGFAAVIGLSCGALVIMLGILVALVVRRRRSAQHVVIPTEDNDDQEHLVQMQKKGFENPTYKFYYY